MKHPNAQIENLLSHLASPCLSSINLSLNRILNLLALVDNPQNHLPPVVHVAGTNGKGSLVAYLTAILQAAGYRVHRFTSPYLMRLNEEIVLANSEISDAALLDVLTRVQAKVTQSPVTYFEALTVAAFLAFRETPADILILETGLGGRLDATNVVVQPAVTAITPISLDHTEFLGHTIAAIAGEKAGIIKPGVMCVVGPQVRQAAQMIDAKATDLKAPLYSFNQEWSIEMAEEGFKYTSAKRQAFFPKPNLVGQHQFNNVATAIAVVDCLKNFNICDEAIVRGITHAIWPARLQRLIQGRLIELISAPVEIWLDGGHNPSAGVVLAAWAKTQSKPLHLICGMLKNKDTQNFLAPLAPYVQSLAAIDIVDEPLSQTPATICEIANKLGIVSGPAESLKQALLSIVEISKGDCIILICGSLYLAGRVLWENEICLN